MVISLENDINVASSSSKVDETQYRVMGGGLAVINSEGHYFPVTEEIRALFNSSSSLIRRMKNGALKIEANHPRRLPNETKEDFVERFMSIDEGRVAALINNIEIGDTPIKIKGQEQGMYPTWLTIEPLGVFGEAIKSDLDSKRSNTALSIRCLSKRGSAGGRVTRSIFHIITWDWVTEPGVNAAKKSVWTDATTEDLSFDSSDLKSILNSMSEDELNTESAKTVKEVVDYLDKCGGASCRMFSEW